MAIALLLKFFTAFHEGCLAFPELTVSDNVKCCFLLSQNSVD